MLTNRPGRGREWAEAILTKYGADRTGVALLGCRGYFRDSMGKPGENDRGIYDDAVFVISPSTFTSFNFNTDPTAEYRQGLACLQSGKVWHYKLGIHGLSKPITQQYMALVQAAAVTVIRDGKGPDTGWLGINIHRGGNTTTSSLGCQTVPPAQWEEFFALVQGQMTRYKQASVPYLLVDQQG